MVRQVAAARELDSAKVGEVFKPESRLISFCLQEGTELPAGWQVGDAALPTSLEERKAFLGLDDRQMEEKRGSHMGEPKVEQHQSAFCMLINFNLTNPGSGHNQPLQPRAEGLWRPRDLSYFFKGL